MAGEFKAKTRIGFTADENFPVFVPVRFTSMWVPGNAEIQSLKNEKDQANEISSRNSADKDRHMTSRVYNPIPYCKPFAAVNIQKSPSTDAVTNVSPNKRRKMADFKETSFNVRKFKTATPYRKPSFEAISVNREWQMNSESPYGKTNTVPIPKSPKSSTQHIAATWPNLNKISPATEGEKRHSHPSPMFPVPYRKTAENTGPSPAPFVPENVKGFDSKVLKKVDVAAEKPHFTDNLVVKKNEAVAKIERYYTHLLTIVENISKEPPPEIKGVNVNQEDKKTNVIPGKTEMDKEELFTEEQSNNTRSPQESDKLSSDTDTHDAEQCVMDSDNRQNVNNQNLMETCNLRFHLINKSKESAHKMLSISQNILVWLFWFLKRYLFLTFILIRLFH
ncbi:uncharacterized protein LOC123545382 [Mercenaria mercenaria]|uniref:uncharacterized protein LOC123545382 n=1 Tax=Mercenaria mercenaria TaxID=6596 RepID=UPI00234F711C|nr:uncharacterized protein LOC123545382 [Mercenaria mercenaria]